MGDGEEEEEAIYCWSLISMLSYKRNQNFHCFLSEELLVKCV